MKYEIQQSQKAEGCERRMVQRRAINAFIFQFRLDNHRPPSRTEIAAHFQKSPAWLDYLAKHEKEDNTLKGAA